MTSTHKKPKLLHVTTVPVVQWNLLRGQNQFMAEHGFEVHAASSPGPFLDKLAARDPVQVHAVPITRRITPLQDLVSLVRLYRLFRRLRPEIVHLSTPKASLLGAIAAAAARMPVRIYHIRGLSSESERGLKRVVFQWLEWFTARFCHWSLSNAFSLLDYAHAEGILRPSEGEVLLKGMANGIDCRRFDPERIAPVTLPPLPANETTVANPVVLGYVGRITRDKGIEELAVAWRQIRSEFPHTQLLLVGPFEAECAVSEPIRAELEADPRVVFAGHQEDVVPYYRAMNIFAFPSHGTEGFPNAPMEAAAMRLPVIATRVSGSVDAVLDGSTGAIIPPRDAPALTVALRTYLQNPKLAAAHGRAGRQWVQQHFQPERIWMALLAEYERLLHERGLPLPQAEMEAASPREFQRLAA
jgi:glycosyltransferase involved in cell wall biosynthesis